MQRLAPLLFLLAASGCGLTARPTVISAPSAFDGFPVESSDEEVWAEAVFYMDHPALLGEDLTSDGALPIGLRIGTLDADAGLDGNLIRINPNTFAPRLYLQDGTVLGVVTDKQRKRTKSLALAERNHGLKQAMLGPWTTSEEEFLFFRLDDVRVQQHYALTKKDGHYRELDLYHSLLAFVVETDDGPREVRVGLRTGYGRGRR